MSRCVPTILPSHPGYGKLKKADPAVLAWASPQPVTARLPSAIVILELEPGKDTQRRFSVAMG
jgi:hypothetical protein